MEDFKVFLKRLSSSGTSLAGRGSKTKIKLLRRLWEELQVEGSEGWVTFVELLNLTQVKSTRVLLMELREESACHLEDGFLNREWAWRLSSTELKPPASSQDSATEP